MRAVVLFGLFCSACLMRGELYPEAVAEDSLIGRCPEEMVAVALGGGGFCIDRYEATVLDGVECSGVAYGVGDADDYPVTFPDGVESAGCGDTCGSAVAEVDLYACSIAASRPSASITWFQARRVCQNVGKYLCENAEWYTGCAGAEIWSYPYGEEIDSTLCNGPDHPAGSALPTGSMEGCEGGVAGLFDLTGNLAEWTGTVGSDEYVANYRGGSYASQRVSDLSCNNLVTGRERGETWPFVGLRCCADLLP